ncbi:MAG: hypothetical protein Q7J65_06105 [Candidatus Marinimicrobia bacterium]|nr:hypothetical protein [Candidatus Neomarinimicrobiota bacterium]
MDLQNKSDLEAYIESHGGSKLGPILADLNLQNNLVDDAVALCQKIITEDPGSPYGYYLIALAEIKSGEIADAIEHLKQTIDLDHGFLDAYYLLVEIGKDQLSPGAVKACYEKIIELNPFDDNARTKAGRISEDADRESLKNIQLPEIKVHKTISRVATEVKPVEPEPEKAVKPEALKKPEPKPESTDEIPAQVGLSEEEAHLGPMIPDEEEEPELEIEPEPEPEGAPETVKPPTPAIPAESVQTPPPPSNIGSSSSALNDMFAKLRSKPLEEVQKENWSLPVVEAPAPEANPNDLIKKPNIKFTVPLKDEIDPKKKLEEIHKEIGLKPLSGAHEPDEKKIKSDEPAIKPPDNKPVKSSPDRPRSSNNISVQSKEFSNGKIELKIPVPTFTLVEVFKKQKLYNEALQLLDVLEKKSKNPERIEKERSDILQLKMEEE